MQYQQFLTRVAEEAGVSEDEADDAARATMQTLGERLAGGEAGDLAAELPPELSEPLESVEIDSDRFDADEFCRRVADREEVSEDEAREHAEAVLHALRDAVTPGEWEDVAEQLPADYASLVNGR